MPKIQSESISRSGLPNQGYSRVLCIALRVLCIPRARVPLCPVLSAGVGGLARGVLGASRLGEVAALVKGTLVSSQIWGFGSLRCKIVVSAPRRRRRGEGYTLRCPLSAAAPPVNQRRVHSRSPPRSRVLQCPVLAQPCKFIHRRVRAGRGARKGYPAVLRIGFTSAASWEQLWRRAFGGVTRALSLSLIERSVLFRIEKTPCWLAN